MVHGESVMAMELREAPAALRRQPQLVAAPLAELVTRCRRAPPRFVVTCARGSSAHAATFAKHLIERHLGIPVAAAAPNIASIYGRSLWLDGALLLTISQSGESDDLAEFTRMAKRAGALAVAVVNETQSPLAAACDVVLPIAAGPERSVAATKSFVATAAVLLRLAAAWAEDRRLSDAVERLPDRLEAAIALDWSMTLDALASAASLITIGRGPTLAIAREAALKLKETCRLHAEAFSGAEVRHGPVAIVSPRYPILMFIPTDAAAAGMRALAADLRRIGANVFVAGEEAPGLCALPVLPADHPGPDALCLIQTFYALAVRLARVRGTDVDRPRHLQKVTRTR
jgi:glucosamine--fructose-6-phosphate aminotransferase (isomerizing)